MTLKSFKLSEQSEQTFKQSEMCHFLFTWRLYKSIIALQYNGPNGLQYNGPNGLQYNGHGPKRSGIRNWSEV